MVQIIGQEGLGERLGTGLGKGLNALAEGKLRQMQLRNIAGGLQAANKNIGEDQAMSLANLDPSTLNQVLKQMQEQDFVNALGGQGQTNSGRHSIPQQQMDQSVQSNTDRGKEPTRSTEESLIQRAVNKGYTIPTNRKAYNDLVKTMREEQIEEKKLTSEERRHAFKETKEDRKALLEGYKTAKDDLEDLQRLEDLETEGEGLSDAGYVEGLKRANIDLPAMLTANDEEFGKITNNFIRNAKQYYGAKISNQEMEQFLRTIPSLSQSPEGRKRVIANLKKIARGKVLHYKAYRQVLRENKGVPPEDMNDQIEDIVDTQLDKLAESFKKDLARKVPEGPSRIKTVAQVAAGTAAPTVGKALLGAGLGAGLGALGGPVGAGVGGLTGAGVGGAIDLIQRMFSK